jgi:hypothetical protein
VAEGDAAEGVELRLSRGAVVSGRVLESRLPLQHAQRVGNAHDLAGAGRGERRDSLRAASPYRRARSACCSPGRRPRDPGGPQTLALAQPEAVLVGADGRPCIWDPFTRDGAIRFTSPARTLENVPPGAYTLRAGAATREVTVAEGGCTSVVLN